ncbi:MAG TPA: histidine phosphatase family protein [Acidimicrobiia bacterium]|nr:histidine phosphatase family protein [Acidimicrobiia bacterium]
MLTRLHLVRHGEVLNPEGLVYADLPGFPLSPLGRDQARDAARHLAGSGTTAVVSSPLDRAVETAGIIADALDLTVTIDPRLTEWDLARRWAGVAWSDLPTVFPGELESYLEHPHDLPFSPETIGAVAERMAAVVHDLERAHPGGIAVAVSHQDPVQALRLHLRGLPLDRLPDGPPPLASVTSLEPGDPSWTEVSRWAPAITPA